MIFLSYMLAFTGFIFLSLAMKRHYKKVQCCRQGESKSSRTRKSLGKLQRLVFRVIGAACLSISSMLCLIDMGIAVGLVQWIGMLTLTALQVSLLLTYRPQWLLVFMPLEELAFLEGEFAVTEREEVSAVVAHQVLPSG